VAAGRHIKNKAPTSTSAIKTTARKETLCFLLTWEAAV